jgi:hypothetical protein
MPHYRQRERKRHQRRWRAALQSALHDVRREINLVGDEAIPDVVLLTEAEHHFLPPGLLAPTQWFGLRLLGLGDGEAERAELAGRLGLLRGGPVPWGVTSDARSSHRSRRASRDVEMVSRHDAEGCG